MFMWQPGRERLDSEYLHRSGPVRWSAPGSCGEFVQGRLDGIDYLVNSPIDRFATATARPRARPGIAVRTPHRHAKVARLLAMLDPRDLPADGLDIELASELPQGKGMASSTADLVAAAGAALHHLGSAFRTAEIARVLVAVEPSDCIHVPGVGHVGHLCGSVFGSFPTPSGLRVLILDCGGTVDTVAFDRTRAHHVYARNVAFVRTALSTALRSLATGDLRGLARAATMSARLSQQILFKAQFDDLLAIAMEAGALGVNCAHSGSVLGVLYQEDGLRGAGLREAIVGRLGAAVSVIGDHAFISGGLYVDRR